MQGLRTADYGAGQVLAEFERTLFERMGDGAAEPDFSGPIRLHEVRVPTDWVDYNGHTNDSRYFQLSSETIDRLLRLIGMDDAYLAGGHSWFTVESHVNFAAQAKAGDQLYCTVQLLSHDPKRMRVFTAMHRAGRRHRGGHRRAHAAARGHDGRQGGAGCAGDDRRRWTASPPTTQRCPSRRTPGAASDRASRNSPRPARRTPVGSGG